MTRDQLTRDLGLALRLLRRTPGLTTAAVLTLALGIGGSTAIFSVLHTVLLRPLPYPAADRLVQFRIESETPAGRFAFDALPAEQALEWRDQSNTLADLALFNDRALTLSTASGPYRLTGIAGTPNLFDIVGVAPLHGRTFDAASRTRTDIVLSYATWQRFFGGHPAIVGTTAMFDGTPYTIAGVMPRDFAFPSLDADFWVPLIVDRGGTRGMLLPAVARLKPGATPAAVVAEGDRALVEDGPMQMRRTFIVRTMQDQLVGSVRRLLWVLMAAVSFVFAIALCNIALLLLTRGASRDREFSVRLALGAGRPDLVRQLTIEGLVLALAGGLGGVLLAAAGVQVLVALAPPDLPRLRDVALDGMTLLFALVLVVVTGVIFGVLSAARALGADPVRSLGRLGGEGHVVLPRSARRRLDALAASALAFTVLLLVGAGLLLRSFAGVLVTDQGFDPDDAIALQVTLPSSRYPSAEARLAFHQRLLEHGQRVPGIQHAGLTISMPNRQPTGRFAFNPIDLPFTGEPFSQSVADVRMVSEGFLEAMGLRLLSGRTFRPDDTDGAEPVMIITEDLARQHFPDRSPIGAMLYSDTGDRRVIGVVTTVKPATEGRPASPAAYLPLRQNFDVLEWAATVTIVLRGPEAPDAGAAIRSLVLSLDPDMPPFNVRTLEEEVSRLVAAPRFSATVLAVFAVTALVLASLGVYGVVSYTTRMRTREIGVRLALGATRAGIFGLVLREGAVIVGTGGTVGLLAATWLAQSLTGLLHAVQPADPVALAAVAGVLVLVGGFAAYVPARRATRIKPTDALRDS